MSDWMEKYVAETENQIRSSWAHAALRSYQRETGTDDEFMLQDLLCDLRHYCDANDLSFADVDRIAQAEYALEVAEERSTK